MTITFLHFCRILSGGIHLSFFHLLQIRMGIYSYFLILVFLVAVCEFATSYPADFTDLDDVDLLLEDKRNFVPTDPEADWIHAESVPFNRDNLMTINRRSVFNWRRPGSRPQFVIPFYRIGDGINYLFDSGVRPTRFGSSRSRMAPYRGIRPY